jgi:hypothetical protein
VGFLRELIGAIGVLKGAFCVPVSGLIVALFVVFGSGPVGVSSKLVLFRGFPVGFMHSGLSYGVAGF